MSALASERRSLLNLALGCLGMALGMRAGAANYARFPDLASGNTGVAVKIEFDYGKARRPGGRGSA